MRTREALEPAPVKLTRLSPRRVRATARLVSHVALVVLIVEALRALGWG